MKEKHRIHQRRGLIPVKVKEKFCDDEDNPCPHYNAELDWCRKKLCKTPLGCEAQTVYVSKEDPAAFEKVRTGFKPAPGN